MRYRKLDVDGDYTFGQGSANFWVNDPQGVAQAISTRLQLWEGEWFLDNTAGTPWSQEVLGYGTQALYDLAIRAAILDTEGVTSIVNYSSTFNSIKRSLTVTGTVMTQYSTQPIPFGPVVL